MGGESQGDRLENGNIWQELLAEVSTRTAVPRINLVCVGDEKIGKTLLIRRLAQHASDFNTSMNASSTLSPEKNMEHMGVSRQENELVAGYHSFQVMEQRQQSQNRLLDEVATMGVWMISDQNYTSLLEFAFNPSLVEQTAILIAIDLSEPWTIKDSLDQWSRILKSILQSQCGRLSEDRQTSLKKKVVNYYLEQEDKYLRIGKVDESIAPLSATVEANAESILPAGILEENFGLPIIVAGCKADGLPEDETVSVFIQHHIRSFCLQYGASLCYTSAKKNINCDVLLKNILHRVHPRSFKLNADPQVIERDSLFIPCGYDSFDLINQTLVGSQRRWVEGADFSSVVPVPDIYRKMKITEENAVDVEQEQAWLRNLLEKGGVASTSAAPKTLKNHLTELSSGTSLASSKTSSGPTASGKDVNPAHLANFFNNLLSRNDKSKSSLRNFDGSGGKERKIRDLAEKELSNMQGK